MSVLILDEAEVFTWFGSTNDLKNYSKLITFIVLLRKLFDAHILLSEVWTEKVAALSGKQRLSFRKMREVFSHHGKEFSKNAADTPNIDFVIIIVLGKNDFRGSVPPGDHMLSQLLLLQFPFGHS